MTLLSAPLCLALAACHGGLDAVDAGDKTVPDAGADAGHSGTPDGGADAGEPTDAGRYTQGVYACCGPSEGLSCCMASEGLLGYELESDGGITPVGARHDGITEANCFQYGGVTHACNAEGDTLVGHDICSICCAGLTAIDTFCGDQPDGACVAGLQGDPGVEVCARCGDGACGTGESVHNCPADCH